MSDQLEILTYGAEHSLLALCGARYAAHAEV